MKHTQYKEWLQLSLYDELTAEERALLDQHLLHCSECREEMEELKQFHAMLLQAGPVAPDDSVLHDARQALRSALRRERNRPPWWDRVAGLFTEFIHPHYKLALGGAAILAVGILAGRLVFSIRTKYKASPEDE